MGRGSRDKALLKNDRHEEKGGRKGRLEERAKADDTGANQKALIFELLLLSTIFLL